MNIPLNINKVIILGLALAGTAIAMLVPPIAQQPDYHNFADQRMILGIRNFSNVVSNLAFIIAGLHGIGFLARNPGSGWLRQGYFVFFSGVLLVGLGSAYYHLDPSNQTLVWDRLPMAVSFMAFFSLIVGECINKEFGAWMLWPLVFSGFASVIYWYATELSGAGDLRPYIIIQFLPALLTAAILLLYRPDNPWRRYIWLVLAAYAAAKIAEMADAQIFSLLGLVSGHTLKHLLAASGAYLFLIALKRRGAAA